MCLTIHIFKNIISGFTKTSQSSSLTSVDNFHFFNFVNWVSIHGDINFFQMKVRVGKFIFGAPVGGDVTPTRGWGRHSTHVCAGFPKKYPTLYFYYFWMRHAFLMFVTPKWRSWLGIYRNHIWKAFHLQKCKV